MCVAVVPRSQLELLASQLSQVNKFKVQRETLSQKTRWKTIEEVTSYLSYCSVVMERHHDQSSSYGRKHLIGDLLTSFRRLVYCHHCGEHSGKYERAIPDVRNPRPDTHVLYHDHTSSTEAAPPISSNCFQEFTPQ